MEWEGDRQVRGRVGSAPAVAPQDVTLRDSQEVWEV